MKRLIIAAFTIAGLTIGVHAMADATQNRRDTVVEGSTTVIEFAVSTRDFSRGPQTAATNLWAVCSATVDGEVSPRPELVGDRWLATVSPAVGEHGRKRLVGCLEDATIDRVVGDVERLETVERADE